MTQFGRPVPFAAWGRIERGAYPMARPRFAGDLPGLFSAKERPGHVLGVGLGRSYGDSCLNNGGGLIAMDGLDRLIEIDKPGLVLRAQAGLSIGKALEALTQRGLTLPVLPGTRFATLGGAVANDVHGKNHALAGTFGRWVRRIGLVRSDGRTLSLAPGDAEGLFAATIGGLGLTGLIAWVEVGLNALDSDDVEIEDIPFETLADYYALMADHAGKAHRVAWIDCTHPGRGIFTHGTPARDEPGARHKTPPGPRFSVPFDGPGFLLNRFSLSLFNKLYRSLKARDGLRRMHYARFHFPLDSIGGWNRLYGGRGFRQYQCAVPKAVAREAVMEILNAVKKAGDGAFLAVLKEFGPLESPGLLSFPLEGSTLALDFRNRGQKTLALLETLDRIVLNAGGRIYPAKDGRVSAQTFQEMYPQWRALEALRDPAIRSDFWARATGMAR
ncbi:MAG: FAD-binding oxidoreductase [Hyphomonadaceae bacterium]|nr:FAD-binding oxidoreductase [Hyphomonadaceae bacterium]